MSTNAKISLDASQYKSEIKQLRQESKTLAAEMKALKSSFDSTTSSSEKTEKVTQKLNQQLETQKKLCEKLKQEMEAIGKNGGTNSTEYLKAAENLAKAETAMHNMENELSNLGQAEESAQPSTLELAAVFATLGTASEKLIDALKVCVDEAVEFESSMASVSRTTGLTGEGLSNMASSFIDMSKSMPVTANELASIATTAGQLGIAQGDIESFTQVIAQLSVVSGMSAEEVATDMAQIGNITRDNNFPAMADTIAVMGDATATTAERILDMSLNLAAAASNAGMTTDEIIALSAAVSSTGVQAQAGGTAISRLIQQINQAVATGDHLQEFADVCNMSAAELKVAWGQDATGTLATFVAGLNQATQAGQNLDAMLSDMGISSQRELVVVKNLASNSELLANALGMANSAYGAGTGLAQKYGVMSSTTEAKMQECANAATALKIAIGDALTPAIAEGAEVGAQLLEPFTNFITAHPEIVRALAAVTASIAALVAGKAAIDLLSGAVAKLGIELTTLAPILAGVAAIAVVGGAIADYASELESLGRVIDDGSKTLQDYQDNLDACNQTLQEAQEEYDKLAACGADLTMADTALTNAKLAVIHATEEFNDKLAEEEELAQAAAEAEAAAAAEAQTGSYKFNVAAQALADLCAEYEASFEAAKKSLSGQFKLFQQVGEVARTTSEEMMSGLRSQQKYWDDYADNIRTLQSLVSGGHLSQSVLDSVIGGSAEDVANAASIVQEYNDALASSNNAGVIFLEGLSRAFEDTQSAMDGAAEAIADVQTDFTKNCDKLVKDMEDCVSDLDKSSDAYTSGMNTIQGLINGIEAMSPTVIARMRQLGKDAMDAYDEEVAIGSPSKEMRQRGKWMVEGLTLGIDDKASSAVNAMASMAQTMLQGYDNAANNIAGGGVGNQVNIYPQSLDESMIDYIYKRMNNRMGVFA